MLVASAVRQHPHHPPAFAAFGQESPRGRPGLSGVTQVAEAYSVLTKLPVEPAIHPSEALRMIEENILERFEVLSLEVDEYREVLYKIAHLG